MKDAPLRIGSWIHWLGLAWVYSAAFWLLAVFTVPWPIDALPAAMGSMLLRMVATLAIGIGLCATERWGWASTVCIAGPYAVFTTALAGTGSWRLMTLPRTTLSWTPVFWGATASLTGFVVVWSWIAAAVSWAVLSLLWQAREHFDVPARRPFTTLARQGAGPAMLVLLVDGYLAFTLWHAWTRP